MPFDQKAYRKKYYEEHKARHNFIVERARKKFGGWVKSLKNGRSCKYCSEAVPICLDWHHRDPSTKLFDISQAVVKVRRSKEKILAEIAKCDLICSNCHRKLHAGLLEASK